MQKNRLQQFYPLMKTREVLLGEIQANPQLSAMFREWGVERQQEFLDFCTGAKGVKMLYDSFFKEIFNPDTVPGRLSELLSLLLKKKVRVIKELEVINTRLGDEASMLIMDVLVQLEDGTIVSVEVQKVGYLFPGQRCACYGADLLLRQYKRVREEGGEKGEKFSFYNIRDVYVIVFYEQSPRELKAVGDTYVHNASMVTDSGAKLNFLQHYILISLDIFRKNYQNGNSRTELDMWLAFLSMDEPDVIADLLERKPEFRAMYDTVYTMCQNTEAVMQMYSKELIEMDRNTTQLMIDMMSDEMNAQAKQLAKKGKQLADQQEQLAEKDKRIAEMEALLAAKSK